MERWLPRLVCVGICLTALARAEAQAQEPASNRFYFVQMTDSHFGSGDNDARNRKIVDMINALPMPIACVVHSGDITSDNLVKPQTLNTATSVLAAIRAPVHYLPGNHDILRAKRFAATLNVYTNAFGPLCSRAEHNGLVFLFMYDEPLRMKLSAAGCDPLGWLQAALEESGDKPVVVVIHSPPVDDFYDNRMRAGWPMEARERFTRLVNSANVKAVIAGHFHRNELHWLGRVPLYVAPPIADYWGRQATFRVYEYADGRLGYRTVYLEE